MAQNPKATVEIHLPIEVAENKEKSPAENTGFVQEMPTVTTLLQRKKLAVTQTGLAPATAISAPASPSANEITIHGASETPEVQPARRRPPKTVTVEEEQKTTFAQAPTRTTTLPSAAKGMGGRTSLTLSQISIRKNGEPPPFRNALYVESTTIKAFEKALGKHKKLGDIKKLDCIEYFSTYFSEISFFAVTQPGSAQGVLGFGNVDLVSGIQNCSLSPNLFPSISDLLSQSATFCGALESLRAEDAQSLGSIGFKQLAYLGVFPVSFKKELLGVWICTASTAQEIPEKELKTLKKLLANLQFEPS